MTLCIHEKAFMLIAMTVIASAFVWATLRIYKSRRNYQDALEIYRRSQGADWS